MMMNIPRAIISIIFAATTCLAFLLVHDSSNDYNDNGNGSYETTTTLRRILAATTTTTNNSTSTLFNEDKDIPSLFPLLPLDYVGFTCMIVGLILAAGGGIGGGGILVPIYILIFDFPVKHSIPLASVTVLGGSIANNILNARKTHPEHPSRPLIDWDLILQLEPMTMAGALIGAELNHLLSDVLLVILLFVLLSLTAYKTLAKAMKLYQKEHDELEELAAKQRRQEDEEESEAAKLILEQQEPAKDKTGSSSYGTISSDSSSSANAAELEDGSNNSTDFLVETDHPSSCYGRQRQKKTFLETDHQPSFTEEQVDQSHINAMKLTGLFVVVTVMNLLKGGPEEGGPLPVDIAVQSCGERCFWITEILMLLVIVVFSIHTRHCILNRDHISLSEIVWDHENTITYPCYAIVAGLVAGLFGVGGGIIKGPLMLALGVHPAVASATSACMILFTSSVSTVSYIMFGLLIYDYAVGCLVIGFVATIVGQTLMSIILAKYKRNSYIAFLIGFVVGISTIAMTIEAVVAILE